MYVCISLGKQMPSESMEIRMTVEVETMVVIVKRMKLMRQFSNEI